MSETTDIGAARIRLIVDDVDFAQVIAQGKNAVIGFGAAAQGAYDKTEKGTRRAADALLDYVNSLGRADTTIDRYLRNASRMGVEKPVLDAATAAWQKHTDAMQVDAQVQADNEAHVRATQAAFKELISTQQLAEKQAQATANAAAQIKFTGISQQNASNAQQSINGLVAPGLNTSDLELQERRREAEAAFLPLLELEVQEQKDNAAAILASQVAYKELITVQQQAATQAQTLANAQAAARVENLAAARAANAQTDINALVAPGLSIDPETQAHRLAAEEAFSAIVTAENEALTKQSVVIDQIATARAQQNAANSQQDFNKLLGIPEQEQAIVLAQRRAQAEAAFLPILEEEAKIEQENTALVGKQQAFLTELENIQATSGKTYYELLQLRAAQLGLGESAGPVIQKIMATNQAMGAGTISAKQYEFALRGLPAQFTDIVVSLQAGQSPLTVLLQQGGQIKDMFGGVGSAIKTVGKELLGIVTNPIFVLVGLVAALALAAYEATSRMTELAIATAKGSQVAGSAQGLSTLAEDLTKLGNISLGNADKAVESLATAGKLTGDNFAEAAQASARWATITGEGVDEVANKFNELATDPLQAVLNGTLRVTAAQYEQLVTLDRIGDKVDEVTLAVKLYQDQINSNSDSVLRNLSDGAKGWIDLKDAISDAVHELGVWTTTSAGLVFNGFKKFGKGSDDLTQGLVGTIDGVNDGGAQAAAAMRTNSGFGGVGTDNAAMGDAVKLTLLQVQANTELQKTYDELGTKQQKFATDLIKLNNTLKNASPDALASKNIQRVGDSFSGAGYAKLVEGLRLKVFGQGPDPTKEIKAWETSALDAIKTVQGAADIQYAEQNLSAQQYYDKSKALAEADKNIQLEAISEQIVALKGRANSEDAIRALEQQRQTVTTEYAAKRAKLDHDELVAIQAKITAYHDYVQGLADSNNQLSRQGDQAASAVTQGSREAALAAAKSNAIYAESIAERRAQDNVDSLGPGEHADAQVQADKDKAAAAAALTTQLTILQGNYDSLTKAESDFLGGSVKAWQDWSASVSNYAQEAGKLFTTVMDGIADSITQAAITGKLSFTSLLTSIEKEIIEFGSKQALKIALNNILPASAGGGAGGGNVAGYLSTLAGFASALSGGSSLAGAVAANNALDNLVAADLPFAKGGAFGSASGLSQYTNSIVKSPTYFPFSKGGTPNVGLMGERPSSPGEAIMPLTRTASGELAVKTVGKQTTRNTLVTQNFLMPQQTTQQSQSQVAVKVYGAAQRAARRA